MTITQFINTLNFTSFLSINMGDKTHISDLNTKNITEGKKMYLTKPWTSILFPPSLFLRQLVKNKGTML
jgi:hypothetical protein